MLTTPCAMPATKRPMRKLQRPPFKQAGTAAVEFALLAVIFFSLVFGIIETARLLFVFNTLQEVTRRGAAAAVKVYPTDTAIAAVRQHAIFRNSPGELMLAPPITDEHIRLSYLAFDLSHIPAGSWPANASENRRVCMTNSHAANCIRFVQVQICDPADASVCNAVPAQMILPFIDLRVPLHRATTIVPVESFGYVPGRLPPGCSC